MNACATASMPAFAGAKRRLTFSLVPVGITYIIMKDLAVPSLWSKATIRTVALLTALTGAVGMGLVVDSLSRFPARMRTYPVEPYYPAVLWTSVAINFACLALLFVAAFLLWRLKRSGRWLSNTVFSFEILYFLGRAWVGLFLSMSSSERAQAIGYAMGATGGTGNMGLALHLITGFPVWALIAINLAYWRLNATERTA